jgi:hypothetical protein
LLSVACTVINEALAGLLASRGKNLVVGIRSMFSGGVDANGTLLADRIYANGLVRGLFRDPAGTREGPFTRADDGSLVPKVADVSIVAARAKTFLSDLPSYIPSRTFALAMLDVVAPSNGSVPRTVDDVRAGIAALPTGDARTALSGLVSASGLKIDDVQKNIENWFNDSMDRASGWYRRKTQKMLLIIGFVLVLCINADTFQVVKTLWNDPALRSGKELAAQRYLSHQTGSLSVDPSQANLQEVTHELGELRDSLPMPVGWNFASKEPITLLSTCSKLVGLLLSTLALSLGAPFWFDILNKFMVVRSTVKPREKSGVESSKDS